eukprot:CAMPEP_0114488800 /NCGR_PEP_ID=MMETSP0109-20121206/1527_1 /TAXON_ID=29199 /ORGANISM="Chlorarachnion reptans, Strain CCCM449" /LENGTH=44 /DNA_ID= /DNA_START= /DNA_END= /DNA_ORIENTATION=
MRLIVATTEPIAAAGLPFFLRASVCRAEEEVEEDDDDDNDDDDD